MSTPALVAELSPVYLVAETLRREARPESRVVYLQPVDAVIDDEFDEEERAQLRQALDEGQAVFLRFSVFALWYEALSWLLWPTRFRGSTHAFLSGYASG